MTLIQSQCMHVLLLTHRDAGACGDYLLGLVFGCGFDQCSDIQPEFRFDSCEEKKIDERRHFKGKCATLGFYC